MIRSILGILILLIVFRFDNLTAQVDPTVMEQINRLMPNPLPLSPNAAALGKFGDYEVTLFNGLPQISIPIFEIQSGPLKVPISLDYHASGIKMTDQAGWVGLGWALSGAGGQITRKVNGTPDENGYFAATAPALIEGASPCSNWYYLRQIAMGQDAQPDIFSYSLLGGKSGRFLLSPQGLQPPYTVPYEPIQINAPDPHLGATQFNKFEIIDERGILHRFGTNAAGTVVTEGSSSQTGGVPSSAKSAWLLMEMIAPNTTDQIGFNYMYGGQSSYSDVNSVISLSDLCSTGSCPPSTPIEMLMNTISGTDQQLISTITFKTGKIEFVPSSTLRHDQPLQSLDHINIWSLLNGQYTLVKTVQFIYSYYRDVTNTRDIELKLDQLQFKDNTGAVVQQYKFTYFTNSFSWNNVYARDLWGFYNGKTTNTDLIPPTTIYYYPNPNDPNGNLPITIGSADRSTSPQYLTEGVLQRIDFPTGGFSQFDYEPHQYSFGGTNYTGSGIRIAKITSSDNGNSPAKIKTYRYGAGESGVGIPNFSPLEYNYSDEQMVKNAVCMSGGAQAGTSIYRSRSYYSRSTFDTDGFETAPVIYPYVTEYSGDAAGNNIGKTVYEFDNGQPPSSGVNLVVPHSTKYFTDSYSWRHGFVTHKTVFDNANNKLTENITTYGNLNMIDKFVGYAVNWYNTYADGSGYCPAQTCTNELGEAVDGSDLAYQELTQSSGAPRAISETEYIYENGNINKYVMNQTDKTYDPNKFVLIKSTVTRSNSTEQSVTVTQYPFQFSSVTNSASTGTAQGIYMLNKQNVVTTPLETYTYIQNSDGSNQRVVSGQVITYRANLLNSTYVGPDATYLWEYPIPVPLSTYAPISVPAANNTVNMDANQKQRININEYDAYGNVIDVTKTNDVLISYQFGYNNSLPVVEVKNAQNLQLPNGINQTTAMVNITMGRNGTTLTETFTFTSDYTGSVTLNLGGAGINASYSGLGTGSASLGSGCGSTGVTFANIPAGTYTITITITGSGPSVGACGNIVYPKNVPIVNSIVEFFYEGFEEHPTSVSYLNDPTHAHAGSQFYYGAYTTPYSIPNSRSYLIEYWYAGSDRVWHYITKPYTGVTMLTDGIYFDDVRIYPTDAQMKSYNYDPILGVRTIIDETSRTLLYDYDNFGRLWRIRNDYGGVEKLFSYNYRGN